MEYTKTIDKILVPKCDDFNPRDILECGQIFRYRKNDDGNYVVLSGSHKAVIVEKENLYEITTNDVDFFEEFFDLKTDYCKIKSAIGKDQFVAKAIKQCPGVRILKNEFVEMTVSFVISANNHIKRIQQIVDGICKGCGEKIDDEDYAFPKLDKLCEKDLDFYNQLHAGYRGKYLVKLAHELKSFDVHSLDHKSTEECKKILQNLSGVGPKVADCILLFGLGRQDVFPIDTWMEQVYHKYYETGLINRNKMREFFVKKFGVNAGYAQQYLFYAQRILKDKKL